MGKYFGTDGIRGVANAELTAELAYKTGVAAAYVLTKDLNRRSCFFIGKDTRISGDFIESALAAGICAAGVDVCSLGVLPTPAIALLTATHSVDAGIVISASHNPFEHNGIKIFGSTGYKLTDEQEAEIEQCMDRLPDDAMKSGEHLGKLMHLEADAQKEYVTHIVASAPCRLDGIRAVIDCANGAAYSTAEEIFKALGADIDIIHHSPNGININDGCGSTHMKSLKERVKHGRYDIGIAFDGDADRCLLVDELGEEVDGDRILGLLAVDMKKKGTLKGDLVATVMSNLGLHTYCERHGIKVTTTGVGDRYVLEEMRRSGHNIGGEQSGHVIVSDYATTGDGQLTAVHFLAMLKNSGKKVSELAVEIPYYPQVTINVRVPNAIKKSVATLPQVKAISEEITQAFGGNGRILIRPSGTEALVRVMVEGENKEMVDTWVKKAASLVEEIALQG